MATSIPQTAAAPGAMLNALHDPAVRRSIRGDPKRYALDNGLITEDMDAEVVLVENTRDTMHIPVAQAGGQFDELRGDELAAIQAAGKASTAGTAGSYSSVSSICSTLASGGTVGTLGTAGSA